MDSEDIAEQNKCLEVWTTPTISARTILELKKIKSHLEKENDQQVMISTVIKIY